MACSLQMTLSKIKQKSETFKTKCLKTESLAKFKLLLTSTSRIHKVVYLLRGTFEPFGVENFALLILKERKKEKKKTQAAALVSSWTREYLLSTEPVGANGSECL